jgi:tetratricopeptide (TPR) repeat protein
MSDETSSFWSMLQHWLFPSIEERTAYYRERLDTLDYSIERYPDTPSSYVLRGELYLEAGFYELAAKDFTIALELADQELKTSDWGVVAQAMRDRARSGLERALKSR